MIRERKPEPELDRLGRESFISLFLAAGRMTDEVKALHREQWCSLTLEELRMLRGLLVKALWGEASLRAGHPLESLPPI